MLRYLQMAENKRGSFKANESDSGVEDINEEEAKRDDKIGTRVDGKCGQTARKSLDKKENTSEINRTIVDTVVCESSTLVEGASEERVQTNKKRHFDVAATVNFSDKTLFENQAKKSRVESPDRSPSNKEKKKKKKKKRLLGEKSRNLLGGFVDNTDHLSNEVKSKKNKHEKIHHKLHDDESESNCHLGLVEGVCGETMQEQHLDTESTPVNSNKKTLHQNQAKESRVESLDRSHSNQEKKKKKRKKSVENLEGFVDSTEHFSHEVKSKKNKHEKRNHKAHKDKSDSNCQEVLVEGVCGETVQGNHEQHLDEENTQVKSNKKTLCQSQAKESRVESPDRSHSNKEKKKKKKKKREKSVEPLEGFVDNTEYLSKEGKSKKNRQEKRKNKAHANETEPNGQLVLVEGVHAGGETVQNNHKQHLDEENTPVNSNKKTLSQNQAKESRVESLERSQGNKEKRKKKKKKGKREKSCERLEEFVDNTDHKRKKGDTCTVNVLSHSSEETSPSQNQASKSRSETPNGSHGTCTVIPEQSDKRQRKKSKTKWSANTSLNHSDTINSPQSSNLASRTDSLQFERSVKIEGTGQNSDQNCEDNELETRRKATEISDIIHQAGWRLSKEQILAFEAEGIKVRNGRWSKQEVDLLHSNMKNFLERHGLSDPKHLLFHSFQSMDKEEAKWWKTFTQENSFYKELGKGIHRSLFLIYRAAQRMYDPTNYVGRYSEDELQELQRLHSIHGNDWATIGQLMERSGVSVNRRCNKIYGDKGKWAHTEVVLLNQTVRSLTNTVEGERVFKNICWTAVASAVKSRNAKQCQQKWLDGMYLTKFTTKIPWTSRDELNLITKLYNMPVTEEVDIDWSEIIQDFSNVPSPYWLRNKWSVLKSKVPDFQNKIFEDHVDYLYNVHGQYLRDKCGIETEHNETEHNA